MVKRILFTILTAALALILSGCVLDSDVGGLLRPPRLTGEYRDIQIALESYINVSLRDEKIAGSVNYTLKYPRSGNTEYRSSFILKDIDGDGSDEAVALYQVGSKSNNMRINLLKKSDGIWGTIADIEGSAPDIQRMDFGDVFGNGKYVLIAGWAVSDVQTRLMNVYSLSGNQLLNCFESVYTDWLVGDFTNNGHDNLLIFSVDPMKNTATAHLWNGGVDGKALNRLGTADIDGYINVFTSMTVEKTVRKVNGINQSVVGVYADATKQSGGMITELVYWDGTRLVAPFYDQARKINIATYRTQAIPSTDIDNDGRIDWPVSSEFSVSPPADESSDAMLLTTWRSWDYDTWSSRKVLDCIMNTKDDYYLRIDDKMLGNVTAAYDSTARAMLLYAASDAGAGEKILIIRAYSASASSSSFTNIYNEKYAFDELSVYSGTIYDAWYSDAPEYNLSPERLSYIFTHYSGGTQNSEK